ncbi:hypothetical protein AGABI1DRAFT_77500 [Agaricus bisporus var. burnettii JB137-S8]|uniref:Nuclear pore complex protein NUP96 C-terminal domain-containing protein n=1 Tax=Agaricus bisporus var. burnettii (strain JB137-S8 / ATCC MYA-4627 / FGSC 10392) TaxID=597362 RepID=K5WQ04_AGABU|nr:uncharacterized protein AGABI1DRAFT_77500 [Agaricus bisporus var. burnettii JB137-S8]EKM77441.1 hypothetical protein AGABI1DRAFT_77500 [Agaricus bisporus var. burnettii JB137-S8]
MARFRAFASESSSSDEEDVRPTRPSPHRSSSPKKPVEEPAEDNESAEEEGLTESEDSSSESSSSDLREDQLVVAVRGGAATHKNNALVQGEDGEIRYAHEVNAQTRVAPLSRDPTIIPWAQQLGVDAQKMHVMQTSLFRMPEEAAALKAIYKPDPKTSRKRLNIYSPPEPLPRKHGRESDVDGLRSESRERRSFAHHVEPPHLPCRKYARVDKATSIANSHEGLFIDAGLALGRSFRVSWGPGGVLVHLGSICNPSSSSSSPSANSSTLYLTNTSATLASNSVNNSSANSSDSETTMTLSHKLLQHHLTNTNIVIDATGVPGASLEPLPSTSSDTTQSSSKAKYLDFASFASIFPSTDFSSTAALFRLGVALFDPVDLHLGGQHNTSSFAAPSAITPDIRNCILSLRRKAALGHWLEEVSKPAVDSDLRTKANGLVSGGSYTPADTAFTHLTGHQIEKACVVAAEGNFIKLSTLISQAGGDEMFRDDIREQLRIWKTDKLGPGAGTGFGSGLIGRGVWKIFSILGGILDDEEEEKELTDKDADVCSGLDWKRVFGLCLWYGQGLEASIADVIRSYEKLISQQSNPTSRPRTVAKPLPPWLLDVQKKKQPGALFSRWNSKPSNSEPYDPLYALIKLHADPTLSLSNVLDPLSFSSSLLEAGVGICWHLYIILSRVMRIRDFADRRPTGHRKTLVNGDGREVTSEDEEREGRYERLVAEGHSPTADLLSSTYAFELESWGMIQEAIFVLLHIQNSSGREKAIQDLLARSAPHLDVWMTNGIVGSLKIPMAWVDEAKAQYALSKGEFYSAYELYLTAGHYNAAHNIAVLELAPDAILAHDLDLVKDLFEVFDSEMKHDKIEEWFVRGKILLDYVHILNRLPQLRDQMESDSEDDVLPATDASVAQEIDDLTRRVPKIIGTLPDVFYRSWTSDRRHAAATDEMAKSLLAATEKIKPYALTQIQPPTLPFVDGAMKVGLVGSVGLARFIKSIEA